MITKTIKLALTDEQTEGLNRHYGDVIGCLEKREPLSVAVLEGLKQALTAVVNGTPEWRALLDEVHGSGDYYCLHLLHEKNEILNLPWSMAVDEVSGKPLGQIPRFYLTKGISGHFTTDPTAPDTAAPPLKVLVMTASPLDTDMTHRLSYEAEEGLILQAFEPLMRRGLVAIDFCDDGSIEALKRKLQTNKYHILHFSGHAVFDDAHQIGFLELEDPITLETALVSARDFAEAVNCNPDYRVPTVMLSSCQTAQGTGEKGLRGVTNHLLRVGVPVVAAMGLSINDYYASYFSAELYRRMAEKQAVLAAFHEALEKLRQKEFEDRVKANIQPPTPLQWLIPNLYLGRPMERVVDWTRAEEGLSFTANRYLFHRDRLLLEHDEKYIFIGRRAEKARIMRPFMDKTPILLKGQGGVGKTALAEHLVQRLIAAQPQTEPFVFDETVKSIEDVLKTLDKFLVAQDNMDATLKVDKFQEGLKKFAFLVSEIAKTHQPVFVFDNLETFQTKPGEAFSGEFADIYEIIHFLCQTGKYHLILTARYPVPGFENLESFDLNQVGLTDFRKKCLYLEVGRIDQYLNQASSLDAAGRGMDFAAVVKLLHETFGGNYRALEFFNGWIIANPDKIKESLDSLESFKQTAAQGAEAVRERMGQNLFFGRLMELLEPYHQGLLVLLSGFRVPVQELALQLQLEENAKSLPEGESIAAHMEYLHGLTLIEISLDRKLGTVFFYVTPIVRDLLESHDTDAAVTFSHPRAGGYFYHRWYNMGEKVASLEEAFYHFDLAGDKEKIAEIGNRLSGFYYEYFFYHNAFYYARRVHERLGDETAPIILNRLALIYDLYGERDRALALYEQALPACRKLGNKQGEGAALNNIGQIYHAKGDYDRALQYLEKSLQIRQDIDDKAGEGATLNNISRIYSARGDYDRALQYLEKSLEIQRDIGDKAGEGTTLNNISQIYDAKGDYDRTLQYLEECLTTFREIGDKAHEGGTLNNMATTAFARGDYDRALKYLEKSLQITRDIGDKAGEGTTLNNISQIYKARFDYDRALKYLEKSLGISRDIGDRSGTATILHNMAGVAYRKNDIEKYLAYETEAHRIAVEINDAKGVYQIGWDLGYILAQGGRKDEGLDMLRRSAEIGKKAGFPDVGEVEEMIKEIEG